MILLGFVHFDFNAIRKGAIRQVVNPHYMGVFSKENILNPRKSFGGTFCARLNEYEEINKVQG